MDEVEVMLNDSLQDSLRDKGAAHPRGRKRGAGSDSDDGEDDDDDFYDRTGSAAKRRKGEAGAAGGRKPQAEVVTLESLCGKQEALRAEIKRLEEEILREEALVVSHCTATRVFAWECWL